MFYKGVVWMSFGDSLFYYVFFILSFINSGNQG